MIIAVTVPSYRSFNILTMDYGFIHYYKEWVGSNKSDNIYKLYILAQDYNSNQQDIIMDKLKGVDCKVEFVGKYNYPLSMVDVRDDCSSLSDGESDMCFMIDDDYKLFPSSMEQLNSGVKYMNSHSQCGYIQFDGFLGGYRQKGFLKVKREGLFYTSSGMLIRKLNLPNVPRFLPTEVRGFPGVGEETVIALTMYKNGFYVGKVKNVKAGSLDTIGRRSYDRKVSNGFWTVDPDLVITDESRGIASVPPEHNPYNRNNTKRITDYIAKNVGISSFDHKLRFEGKFWNKYIETATEKFGFCEGDQLLDQLVPF